MSTGMSFREISDFLPVTIILQVFALLFDTSYVPTEAN